MKRRFQFWYSFQLGLNKRVAGLLQRKPKKYTSRTQHPFNTQGFKSNCRIFSIEKHFIGDCDAAPIQALVQKSKAHSARKTLNLMEKTTSSRFTKTSGSSYDEYMFL